MNKRDGHRPKRKSEKRKRAIAKFYGGKHLKAPLRMEKLGNARVGDKKGGKLKEGGETAGPLGPWAT